MNERTKKTIADTIKSICILYLTGLIFGLIIFGVYALIIKPPKHVPQYTPKYSEKTDISNLLNESGILDLTKVRTNPIIEYNNGNMFLEAAEAGWGSWIYDGEIGVTEDNLCHLKEHRQTVYEIKLSTALLHCTVFLPISIIIGIIVFGCLRDLVLFVKKYSSF